MKIWRTVWHMANAHGYEIAAEADLVNIGLSLTGDKRVRDGAARLREMGVKLISHFPGHELNPDWLKWGGPRGDFGRRIWREHRDWLLETTREPWIVTANPELFGCEAAFCRNIPEWSAHWATEAELELVEGFPVDGFQIDSCSNNLVEEMLRSGPVFRGEEYIIPEHVAEWEEGSAEFRATCRAAVGESVILIPNGRDHFDSTNFDGVFFECFAGQWRSMREDLETLGRDLTLIYGSRGRHSVIGFKGQSPEETDWQKLRMTTAVAMMSESYHYAYAGDYDTTPIWCDEYSVDGKGRARPHDLSLKGWEGAPIGEATMEGGVMMREFEHALTIVSLWDAVVERPKGEWEHIAGTDSVNTGRPVKWPIIMPAQSGIVLHRRELPLVKPVDATS